jgi:hypothetical protein
MNITRESWLNKVADKHLWPLIVAHDGKQPPKVRISVGFPRGSRGGNRTIGQCWSTENSTDKTFEIFISPTQDAYSAVEILIHELIHASVGLKVGHKGPFKRLALAVGLIGKMTATVAGPGLKMAIQQWMTKLPAYPHAPMKVGKNPSKQTTRLIKCTCDTCGYTVRTTQKWIQVGEPHCPNHGQMEIKQ